MNASDNNAGDHAEEMGWNKRFSVTLDERQAELLTKAVLLAVHPWQGETKSWSRAYYSGQRNWVVRWMIQAVTAAIVASGEMPCPLGVNLRSESREEAIARRGQEAVEKQESLAREESAR